MISSVKMLEPGSATLVLYLMEKSFNRKYHKYAKNPLSLKKRACLWLKKNSEILLDIGADEIGDYIVNDLNIIHNITIVNHISIFHILYIIAIIITILF